MSTQDPQAPGDGGQADQQPTPPAAQPTEPAAETPAPPAAPSDPVTPPAAPEQGAPVPPPQAPPAQPTPPPVYQAPPQPGPQQPGASQAPPQQEYPAPPQAGYTQPAVSDPVSNIQLNYWLSVFFTWIPALIFFLIDKDKGDRTLRGYQADNLNFSLIRVIAGVAIYILALIPYVGWVLAVLLWIGEIVLFIFHIMAAAKAANAFRANQKAPFIFNLEMVK